ncbi:methyltransferase domain-containing protein [Corynebacterium aquilae]|uniref:SAM-dependent methyltransferase n=1 Tax=Corynebacterium aquilae DSM 44791 TaxID=1431546 RepID=A0A1L7CF79_9CORY|nr:methyltransferase domain-containing protein [Corynebacterium aquilae]APT84486.1 SAM-dependent methyltransferase [Corynebacterium aquilae DSM 44791]
MLTDIVDVLATPGDFQPLSMADDGLSLVAADGRSFPINESGYVTIAGAEGLRYQGDDAEMISAREAFLSRGHYATFVEAVTAAVHDALDDAGVDDDASPVLLEVGAGTGYYLSHSLDSIPGSTGVGIDVSLPAASILAHCHPRVGAVVADAWAQLPLKDNSVDVIAVAFAPRNASEFARVLKPGGQVVVLTDVPGHLLELREPLGITDVEEGKLERLIDQASSHLTPIAEPEIIEFPMTLDQQSIAAQIGMSPSARHIHPDVLGRRIAALPDHMTVTARAAILRFAARSEEN